MSGPIEFGALQDHINVMGQQFIETEDGESYDLSAEKRVAKLTCPGNGESATIVLPPVEEVGGKMFSGKVIAIGHASNNGITLKDALGVDILGDAMTAVGDGYLVYSDGVNWWPLKETTT